MSSVVSTVDQGVQFGKKQHQAMDLQSPSISAKTAVASHADDDGIDLFPASQREEATPPEKFACGGDDTSESGSSACTSSRPIGLKRSAASCEEESTPTRKRLYKGSLNQLGNIDVKMIQQLDPNITVEEANAVLRDYTCAIKIMKLTNASHTPDPTPTLEYMIKLINDWQPKRDIICMYV